MAKEIKYCPEHIEELISDVKKLGCRKHWLKCPICGYREEGKENNNQANNLTERRKRNNEKGGKKPESDELY